MSTGSGKSLTYQVPALLMDGLTVVVSPLIALMKDQVEQLRELGVPAVFLNSSLPTHEYQANMDAVTRGHAKLLYVAPETLLTPKLDALLSSVNLDLLAIDEAHCISEWGHDFRPDYRQLVAARKKFPAAVCMALTATATPRVRADIMSSLGFAQTNEFVASFNRDNLFIEVLPKRDPVAQTLRLLDKFKDQSGIIYCFSRKQVDELAATLARCGCSVCPYHAGLSAADRKRHQEAFIRDDVQIIVATIAFGMGINKPNVRFVIHFDLPKSIESYYQEIGRAGRDGLPSHCLLLYSYGDASKIKWFIGQREEPDRPPLYEQLDAMTRYAEGRICRRRPLLSYFGETFGGDNCGTCDNCSLETGALTDITIPAHKFLSCVQLSGERFGAAHIVDILLGAANDKMRKYCHDTLATYGTGTQWTKAQWLQIARQLVERGWLRQEPAYRVLSVTALGLNMLASQEQVRGNIDTATKSGRSIARVKATPDVDYDRPLFGLLRKKRKELADAAGVPPYVIFSDKTLVEMAVYFPQGREAFLKINGVGEVKYARYGEAFIAIIKEYCGSQAIQELERTPLRVAGQDAARRYVTVGAAYNAGESLAGLVKRFAVSADTILNHLLRYVMAGNQLRSAEDLIAISKLSPDQQQRVLSARLQDFGEAADLHSSVVSEWFPGEDDRWVRSEQVDGRR
ncbi:MAG: DNA helicase RecQ, partial [Pirellulaceae bacterium]